MEHFLCLQKKVKCAKLCTDASKVPTTVSSAPDVPTFNFCKAMNGGASTSTTEGCFILKFANHILQTHNVQPIIPTDFFSIVRTLPLKNVAKPVLSIV